MARLVLDGVVVRHSVHPAEALFERSPIIFAAVVFIITACWLVIASAIENQIITLVGTPIVIFAAVLSPHWLSTRPEIEGNRRVILDERGLQIEGILIPWNDLEIRRHGTKETATTLWTVGSETIVASFEHQDERFSAFLGVRFRTLHPFVSSEKLHRTLSEREVLKLEGVLGEYVEFKEDTRTEPTSYPTEQLWEDEFSPSP